MIRIGIVWFLILATWVVGYATWIVWPVNALR